MRNLAQKTTALFFGLLMVLTTLVPAQADSSLELTKERTVVYFGAPWCLPCRQMTPELKKFAENKGIGLIKVNADDEEGPAIERFGRYLDEMAELPFIVILDKKGTVQGEITGLITAADLKSEVDATLVPGFKYVRPKAKN